MNVKNLWCTKTEINFLMSHKNENFLTLDYILLLRAIKIYHYNMTFLTMSKTKIWRCTKNNFVSKQKVWCYSKSYLVSTKTSWCCTKKCFMSTKKSWCCTKKVFRVHKNKTVLHKKKYFALKVINFFQNGAP